MSRIGRKPIIIPDQATVNIENGKILVSGPKGSQEWTIPAKINVSQEDGKLVLSKLNEEKQTRALFGTARQIIANMLTGVTEGWQKTLEIIGTGFRANMQGDKLVLSLGFSHTVDIMPPSGINFSVNENKVTVSGADKVLVGQIAANIRGVKPPDAYKGKGVRYLDERIKLKAGKAAAKVGGAK